MAQTARSLDVPLLLGVDTHHFGPQGVQVLQLGGLRRPRRPAVGPLRQDAPGDVRRVRAVCPVLSLAATAHAAAGQRRRPASGRRRSISAAFASRPNICYESVLSHVIRGQVNALAAEGQRARHPGEPDQRRLVLGLQRVGHAPGLRGVSGGGMPQAVSDRRQHGLFGLDRRRRPHPRARPATGHEQSSSPSRGSTIATVGISPTATGLPACVWRRAGCADWWGFSDGGQPLRE